MERLVWALLPRAAAVDTWTWPCRPAAAVSVCALQTCSSDAGPGTKEAAAQAARRWFSIPTLRLILP